MMEQTHIHTDVYTLKKMLLDTLFSKLFFLLFVPFFHLRRTKYLHVVFVLRVVVDPLEIGGGSCSVGLYFIREREKREIMYLEEHNNEFQTTTRKTKETNSSSSSSKKQNNKPHHEITIVHIMRVQRRKEDDFLLKEEVSVRESEKTQLLKSLIYPRHLGG